MTLWSEQVASLYCRTSRMTQVSVEEAMHAWWSSWLIQFKTTKSRRLITLAVVVFCMMMMRSMINGVCNAIFVLQCWQWYTLLQWIFLRWTNDNSHIKDISYISYQEWDIWYYIVYTQYWKRNSIVCTCGKHGLKINLYGNIM